MIKRVGRGVRHIVEAVERHPLRVIVLDVLLGAKVIANCNLTFGESCDTSGLRGILPDPIDIIGAVGMIAPGAEQYA